MKIKAPSARGRNDFHVSAMRRSYRIRGNEARTQMKRAARLRVLMASGRSEIRGCVGVFRNKTVVIRLIIRILTYSAIKIKAKVPPPNSILNPETSSDSPSAKSKGVRFVSASVEINHMAHRIGRRRATGH